MPPDLAAHDAAATAEQPLRERGPGQAGPRGAGNSSPEGSGNVWESIWPWQPTDGTGIDGLRPGEVACYLSDASGLSTPRHQEGILIPLCAKSYGVCSRRIEMAQLVPA